MILKDLKISEAKEIIKSKGYVGNNVFTLVQDLDKFDDMKKCEDIIEKQIKSFACGGFVHIASNENGRGIVEFCERNNLPIKTLHNDKTVVQVDDFKLYTTARNLAILSATTDIKISKGLLLKFKKANEVINDLDKILETARSIKIF